MNRTVIEKCINALRKIDVPPSRAMDFVYHDEDGNRVLGPDGLLGWFNDGSQELAFQGISPQDIRFFRELYMLSSAIALPKNALFTNEDWNLMEGFQRTVIEQY